MKRLLFAFLLSSLSALSAEDLAPAQPAPPAEHSDKIILHATSEKAPVPLFCEARTEQVSTFITDQEIRHRILLSGQILQGGGKDQPLSLALNGVGEIEHIDCDQLASWSLRSEKNQRYLDLEFKKGTREFAGKITAKTDLKKKQGHAVSLLHLGKGNGKINESAVGYSALVKVAPQVGYQLKTLKAEFFTPLESPSNEPKRTHFSTQSGGELSFQIYRNGALADPAEVQKISLHGEVSEEDDYARFTLKAKIMVTEKEASLPILRGQQLALETLPEGIRLQLQPPVKGLSTYLLHFDAPGLYDLKFSFLAKIPDGLTRRLNFTIPVGHVVPVHLTGLGKNIEFETPSGQEFAPRRQGDSWNGFIPMSGLCQAIWKEKSTSGNGKLFYNSNSLEQTTLKAGLLEQRWALQLKVLQGTLTTLTCDLAGEGEILSVVGPNITDWKVGSGAGPNKRTLTIRLSRPLTKETTFHLQSQSALGAFPVKTTPLQITPRDSARHTGFIRISPSGAVRLEMANLQGLTQLSPSQWPLNEQSNTPQNRRDGKKSEAVDPSIDQEKGVFVYRYPLPTRRYEILADQIQPEVNISQTLLYEVGTTDRLIKADLELDILDAPLREWNFTIPASYSVVSLTGAEVTDYVVGTQTEAESLQLKVLFGREVIGRQLLKLHLEKNEAAAPGAWELTPLRHPDAQSLRGTLGIVAAPGFRTLLKESEHLAEKPLTHFPGTPAGLQHVYRLRDSSWSASMEIEQLPQSVNADLYHLHSLKDGIDYASVVINYFITGAPVGEWSLKLPQGAGNVSVEGHDIRTFRQQGDELIVTLQQPVLGLYNLLVTYEKEIGAQGGTLYAGQVSPQGVNSERGFIQVVSPVQVRHEVSQATKGLLKLDLLELPAEYRLLTSTPTLATYQYTARPFALELDIEWFDPAEMLSQIINLSEVDSRISRDGQVVTDLIYHLKSRGKSVLRLTLPANSILWKIKVNGEPVNARSDGADTLIPLPAALGSQGTALNDQIKVELTLGQKADNKKRIPLALPIAGAPILKLTWDVHAGRGQLLRPHSATQDLIASQPTRGGRPSGGGGESSGLQWISSTAFAVSLFLLVTLALGFFLVRGTRSTSSSGLSRSFGHLCLLTGLIASLGLTFLAFTSSSKAGGAGEPTLSFQPKVIAAGEQIQLVVENTASTATHVSLFGSGLLLLGLALLAYTFFRKKETDSPSVLLFVGSLLILLGLLLQGMGAAWFYLALSIGLLAVLIPRWNRGRKARQHNKTKQGKESEALEKNPSPPPPPENPQPISVQNEKAASPDHTPESE